MNIKKTAIIVISASLLLILIFVLKNKQEPAVQAADFLPADVLFYAEQNDFTEMYQRFFDSRLGKTLISLDYRAIETELGGTEETIREAERLWKRISTTLENPAFNELLGKEFCMALFPAKSFSPENPAQDLEERLLLIAKPRHNAKFLQLLAPLFKKDIKQSTVQYGAHTISRYQIDANNRLSTATVQGLVLAGFDERLVRKSIDSYDDRTNVLSKNKDFQRLRSNFKDAKLFTYFSMPAVFDQGCMIAENLPPEHKEEFLSLLKQWEGWGSVAYGAWHAKGQVTDKVEILFDKSNLDSGIAKLCNVPKAENKTLAMVPADTLFYYWANFLNLLDIWDIYSERVTRQQPHAFDVLRQELRDGGDVEIEEVLGMIDNEFAVIVRDVGQDGIPLPRAAAIIQLKQPEQFLGVFNKLLAEADIPMSDEKYKDKIITYWGIAPQGGFQPAFTLLDNYLLLSNSIDLVQQIVDLGEEPSRSLLKSAAIDKLGGKLLEKNNSATYIHVALFADALKDLAKWAGNMAILQGPEKARKAEIVVNQLILPVLDGVSMYKQLGSRSFITDDSIVLESVTTVAE